MARGYRRRFEPNFNSAGEREMHSNPTSSALTWGLMICTYNRHTQLLECVRHALQQTRPPRQIVIVDASENWEETKRMLLNEFANAFDSIEFIYVEATTRSLTHQRNQALALSTSDILFAIDDDSYMYHDCAERIMNAYEADEARSIALIGADIRLRPPGDAQAAPAVRAASRSPTLSERIRAFVRGRVERLVAMDRHFVPYAGRRSARQLPQSMKSPLEPCGVVNGFRTTFRREYGQQVGWNEDLLYYAIHEDGDFSYRISELGGVFMAKGAYVFHAQAASGRLPRRVVDTLKVLNLIVLHKRYSHDKLRSAFRLAISFSQYLAIYSIVDVARKRWALPTVRAYAYGLLMIPVILWTPRADFRSWYADMQRSMIASAK